jgi:hypothetical protein
MPLKGGTIMNWQRFGFLLFALVFSAGCAETRRVTSVDKSGFLGEELYSKLRRGDESKAQPTLGWRDESVTYEKFTKVILDPIVLYSGEVIGAGVDRRVGGKTLGKGLNSWADVKNAMDTWAAQGRYRACVVTKKPDCGETPKL